MSAEANKALVRRFYEETNKGNLDAMDELVATSSLRNGIETNYVFGMYRAPVTKDSVDSTASENPATIRIWMPQ